jgi:hypothetical protein
MESCSFRADFPDEPAIIETCAHARRRRHPGAVVLPPFGTGANVVLRGALLGECHRSATQELQAARRSWVSCSLCICEALGGNWGYSGEEGWGNSGKDG